MEYNTSLERYGSILHCERTCQSELSVWSRVITHSWTYFDSLRWRRTTMCADISSWIRAMVVRNQYKVHSVNHTHTRHVDNLCHNVKLRPRGRHGHDESWLNYVCKRQAYTCADAIELVEGVSEGIHKQNLLSVHRCGLNPLNICHCSCSIHLQLQFANQVMSDETGPKGFRVQPTPPIDADQSTYIPVTTP